MNYNSETFWLLFAALMLPYWSLSHRWQNRLLLVVSYIFYGYWDHRFLFLILLSTLIDFIGGLGVAGIRLPTRKLLGLIAVLVGAGELLCAGLRIEQLRPWLLGQVAADQVLGTYADWHSHGATLAALGVGVAYLLLQPWLFAQSESIRRRSYLLISLGANLGILGYFKYFEFFLSSWLALLSRLGFSDVSHQAWGIILPAGISFYTFQSMSYCVDIYRREAEATDDFGDFALFVCFFPHLVAGPIMRAHTLLPQVLQPRTIRRGDVEEGLYLVLAGLFKKLVIADNLAPLANAVFWQFPTGSPGASGEADPATGADVLFATYAFALQIYADFSGYSSVARGISKWLGFELVINFDQPYLAVSPSDFWRRWHISLSTWLRDYLYIPLGGNRYGVWNNYRNLLLTMLLGGLWHGANWTFVAWGAYHGVILCLFRAFGIRDPKPDGSWSGRAWYLVRLGLMFHLTCFGWLLFRAEDFPTVLRMTAAVVTDFAPSARQLTPLLMCLFYAGPILALEAWLAGEQRIQRLTEHHWMLRGAVYAYFVVMMLVFQAETASEFIYFQF